MGHAACAGQWTSGRVETRRTDFAAPVGGELALTASIRQPNPASGLGYWPAFWALGAAARPVGATNWPGIGELDVLEDVNASSQVSHTFHCGVWGQPPCNEPEGIGSGLLSCANCQTSFHTYTVIEDRRNSQDERQVAHSRSRLPLSALLSFDWRKLTCGAPPQKGQVRSPPASSLPTGIVPVSASHFA